MSAGGRPSVLIVDDEEMVSRALGRWLASKGFAVQTTNAPLRLRRELEQHHWDVVITDFHMPGMDGLEVLELVQQVAPRTVRCLISGLIELAPVDQIAALYPVLLFPKPFDLDALLNALNGALSQRREVARVEYV